MYDISIWIFFGQMSIIFMHLLSFLLFRCYRHTCTFFHVNAAQDCLSLLQFCCLSHHSACSLMHLCSKITKLMKHCISESIEDGNPKKLVAFSHFPCFDFSLEHQLQPALFSLFNEKSHHVFIFMTSRVRLMP